MTRKIAGSHSVIPRTNGSQPMMANYRSKTLTTLSILFFLTILGTLDLASRPQIQDTTRDDLKRSDRYYWGEATSENEKEASDRALVQLTQSIAVTVSSSLQQSIREKAGKYDEVVDAILKTYSNATLKNIRTIKRRQDGEVWVFHFIERSEVEKVFQQRLEFVRNIFDKASEFQQAMNLGDALKWYYFGIILLNSVPEQIVRHNGANMLTEIPSRINAMILSTKLSVVKDTRPSATEREIVFSVTSDGRPVQNLEINFWDGQNQVGVRASDGEAIVRLVGSSVQFDALDVNVKYSYYECRDEFKEVAGLWDFVIRPSFKNARQVDLKKTTAPPLRPVAASGLPPFHLKLRDNDSCPVLPAIGRETSDLLAILRNADTSAIARAYGGDPFLKRRLMNILRYSAPRMIDDSVAADVNRTFSGWELRRIRAFTAYPGLQKQATEYLTLDFTPGGTLYDVNFGFMENLYQSYVAEGRNAGDWSNRQVIIKFVERYRTAFLCHDIAMLDSLFADEAVIIVGRELRTGKKRDEYQYARLNPSQPDIAYIQMTKKEYLRRQSAVFNREPEILLGFSSFRITRKNDQRGTYGVSMRQNYLSGSYADEGYLFLLVDFYSDVPQIYVRSWQPQEWDEKSLVKLANFRVNR